MYKSLSKQLQKHTIWLSLVLHLLILMSLTFGFSFQSKNQERPALFIPSYLLQQESKNTFQQQPQQKQDLEDLPKHDNDLPLDSNKKNGGAENLNRNQTINISSAAEEEPVHLIGDKKLNQPILELLGKALTAHLVYPKSALDLNVRGTAIISFMLYPDGHLTDIKLLKSSSAAVLDDSAIKAAYAISPIAKIDRYLKKPEYMVIGIIFG